MPSRRNTSDSDAGRTVKSDPATVHPCWFFVCVLLSAIPSILTVVWVLHYAGGLAWDGSHQQFNWHPLCLVLGMVTFFSNGLMAFRIFPFGRRCRKIIHATLNATALLFAIVGLTAVFQNHQAKGIPHLYSLHSWCGLAAVTFFFMQWVSGLLSFVLPILGVETRANYLPYHIRAGFLIFALTIATCLIGLNEKMVFLGSGSHIESSSSSHHHAAPVKYKDLPPQAILVNIIGLFLASLCAAVFCVVTQPDYTRSGRNGGFQLLPMK